MSLFDSASLVVTPNGQKAGKLYSIKPTDGSGDLSVVRATSATRVDANGLVEIPRTNLLLQSQTFDNAYWAKVFGGVASAPVVTANVETAPDGTTTADRVVFNLNGGTLSTAISQLESASFTSVSITRTQSFYIKTTDGTTKVFSFVSPTGVATSITVTSSYQRFTYTTTGINAGTIRLRLRGSASGEGTASSASIAIWGAQYEEGNVATEYIPTVASIRTKFAGITQDGSSASNIPRLDYTNGSCPSILVEPQRTNLVLRSEEFSNIVWEKGTPITLVSNTTETTSPQGINNATKATANGTGLIHIRQTVFAATTLPTTNSIFVKKANNRYVGFRNGGAGTLHDVFDFDTETWTNNSGSILSFDKLVNGWYRLKSSRTNTLPNTYISITIPNNTSGNESATVSNLTLYLWGSQSELNVLNATSYIPTIASTVTRNADVISKTGISSLIGQTEGTLFVDANLSVNASERRLLTISNGTETQRIFVWTLGTTLYTSFNGVSVNLGNFPIGTTKIAVGYTISGGSTTYSIKVNNNTLVTGTAAAAPNPLSAINLGSSATGVLTLTDRVNLTTIWKTRLTNAELAQLTTI
jgi:hypothetical protein